MRAVIYARFSTDKQSDTSIDDQVRVCRDRAARLGLEVATVYSDAAVSGATYVAARAGGAALLADRFDVLLMESLSRLSRDSVDGEMVIRRLEHNGVRIVAGAYDSGMGSARKVIRAFDGAMNEKYRDDLAIWTHRGLTGQVVRGYIAGGASYGYRSVLAGLDAKGDPLGYRLEVVPDAAAIVREIFDRYAAGESCQRIAAELNARGVRGPRGGTWSVSALYGAPAKGAGILNNELYVGRYVWNRSHWVRDPDTQKRQRFLRPPSEWLTDARPELRIVSDETWHAVRARMDGTRLTSGRAGRGGQPTTLLGGILRCGVCGGAVVKVSARSYGCANHRNRGPAVCTGVDARQDAVDGALVGHVRTALTAPEVVRRIEEHATAILEDRERQGGSRRALAERVRELDAEARRLVDAIAAVGISPALTRKLRDVEAQAEAARRALAAAPASKGTTAVREAVRAGLLSIRADLEGNLQAARDALRACLGDVRLLAEGPAVYAVFEDTAQRLMLRAVNGSGCGGKI